MLSKALGAKPLRITRVLAYRVGLPLHEGAYKWSGGKSVETFDCTVVRLETDQGVVGYGGTIRSQYDSTTMYVSVATMVSLVVWPLLV
jgi:L-alanine-DL-glutamate epimerase-like enolase superfamily enzyme